MQIFLLREFTPQSWPGPHWKHGFLPDAFALMSLHCNVEGSEQCFRFLVSSLIEYKCRTKHCDCKLDMTLPEEPAEGMESSQGMSVLWHRLRERFQCSVLAEDPLCWKLCPQHCSQAGGDEPSNTHSLATWRYAAFLLDAAIGDLN